MSNKERGQTTLVVEGQTYTLALTTNALCELEDLLSQKAGKTVGFQEAIGRLEQNSLATLRAVIWAALREHHSELSVKDVGVLIERAGGLVGGVTKFSELLKALVESTMPDPEDRSAAKGDRPPKAQATRGAGVTSTSKRAASA